MLSLGKVQLFINNSSNSFLNFFKILSLVQSLHLNTYTLSNVQMSNLAVQQSTTKQQNEDFRKIIITEEMLIAY